jgi:type I restriction enzyme S subunit
MSDQYIETGVPFLRSQDIRPGFIDTSNLKFISEEFHGRIRKSRLNPGDVAIVRTGYPGTAAVVPESLPEANCSDLVIARPGPSLQARFLAYVLNSPWGRGQIGGRLVGAAQQHFNVRVAQALEIPFPPLEAQRRIASILGAYDDLIEVNRRRIAVLEEMARGLFEESVKEAELTARLFDIARVAYGKNLPKSRLSDDGPYPVYGASKVIGRHSLFTHAARTILVGCRGTVGQFQISQPNSFITNNSFTIEPKDELDFAWLYFVLRKRGVADIVSGSAQPQITLEGASRIEVIFPKKELRSQFADLALPMMHATWTMLEANERLTASRDLLLPRLISGQLSVVEAERQLEEAA